MNNQTHTPESHDSLYLAYGQQVKTLLEMSSPAEMAENLWEIYSGFVNSEKVNGYNPRQADLFLTFRELMLFCQRIQAMK
jgi:hypothetical protein